jgi:hypothetical protein
MAENEALNSTPVPSQKENNFHMKYRKPVTIYKERIGFFF